MRFTRAAKVAAFPLTALILVALVACQGPAGPAVTGPTGPTGPSGPAGPAVTGPSGPQGIGALVITNITKTPILVNHISRNSDNVLGTGKVTVDITPHFRGGKKPIAYTLATPIAMGSVFTADLDEDTGMLTISARSATAIVKGPSYEDGEMVMFRATDADKVATAPVTLWVKANREPEFPMTDIAFAVGMQNAMDAMRDGLDATGKQTTIQPNPVCTTFGLCVFSIKLNDSNEMNDATFTANVEGIPPADDDRQVVIKDDDTIGMTFSVVSHDPQVQASASGTKITIVGLKTTVKAGTDMLAAVKIKATDANDLSVERVIMVSVDTPPEIKSKFEPSYSLSQNAGVDGQPLINDVADHFKDAETSTLMITVETSDAQKVAFPDIYKDGLVEDTKILNVIPKNQGRAIITVTASDDHGQMVQQMFTVIVTAAASGG